MKHTKTELHTEHGVVFAQVHQWSLSNGVSEPGILSKKCKMRSLQAKSATVPLWLDGDLGGNSSPVEVSWSFAIGFDGANIPLLMQTFHNNLLC